MSDKEMQNLGWANGWGIGKDPEIVQNCRKLRETEEGHGKMPEGRGRSGNCVSNYGCDKCGFWYSVDSSG